MKQRMETSNEIPREGEKQENDNNKNNKQSSIKTKTTTKLDGILKKFEKAFAKWFSLGVKILELCRDFNNNKNIKMMLAINSARIG